MPTSSGIWVPTDPAVLAPSQIIINALDARSFEQFLLQPVASTAMVRAIKKPYRTRRL